MKSPPPLPLPRPLAGLCDYSTGARPGIGVDTIVTRLRRLVFLKASLTKIAAAHFCAVPEWEVKCALGLHLWQDAEHSTWLRRRITEMRTPPHHLDRVPAPELGALMEELQRSADSVELLAAIYQVIRPAVIAGIERHLAESNPVADQPTRRLLRFMALEEREQVAWGQDALDALVRRAGGKGDDSALESWRSHLSAYLGAAGGVFGEEKFSGEQALPAPRAKAPFQLVREPRRDERFPHVWNSRGAVPGPDRPVHERIWWMMNVRLQEMHVPELIATVLYEWKDQPWEFYHDLARHLWDEVRHSMLGEIAFASQGVDFTKIPAHIGFASYPNAHLDPPERYAFLWGIEQSLMTKSGKQAEVALAKAGGNERAAVLQDFDWADEVLHAQIGRRWLKAHFGDSETLFAIYERVRPAYDRMKNADLKKPGRDWWPAFYEQQLKHRDPGLGGDPRDAPPTAGSGY